MKGALACAAEAARVLKASGPFPGRARDHRDRHARGAGRPRRGSHVAAPRARLPLRLRRRLRAERRHLPGGAHGPGDGRDHDRPARPRHARAEDRGRDAASDHGGRPRDRRDRVRATPSWRRPSIRGSGRRRTSSARCTAATSTTASRPSAASSARAAGRRATRSRRSRPSSASCSSRSLPRPAARSSSTSSSSAAPTRSIPSTSSRWRCGPATGTSRARSCRSTGDQGRRRRRSVSGRGGDPDGLPRPGRHRSPRRRRVHARRRARPRDEGLPARCSSTCGPRERTAALVRGAPDVVSVGAPRRRQHRRRGRGSPTARGTRDPRHGRTRDHPHRHASASWPRPPTGSPTRSSRRASWRATASH